MRAQLYDRRHHLANDLLFLLFVAHMNYVRHLEVIGHLHILLNSAFVIRAIYMSMRCCIFDVGFLSKIFYMYLVVKLKFTIRCNQKKTKQLLHCLVTFHFILLFFLFFNVLFYFFNFFSFIFKFRSHTEFFVFVIIFSSHRTKF